MSALESRGLEDEVDDALRDDVGEAEEGAGDHDEAKHDGRGLTDLLAIGPLDALKLGPAGTQKADEARDGRLLVHGRRRAVAGAVADLVANVIVVVVEVDDRRSLAEILRRSAAGDRRIEGLIGVGQP